MLEGVFLETGVMPARLEGRPHLQAFDTEVWNAFNRLSGRRPVSGFGAVGAIPFVEIEAYLRLVARITDQEDHDLFVELIDHLDQQFLKAFIEKQWAESAKKPKKTR